jgi:hypothetical protein
VRKVFPPFRFAACALYLLSLITLRAYAQDREHDQDQGQKKDHPNGIVQDWSRRYLAYPRFGPIESLIAVQNDPRAILSWQADEREDWHRAKDRERDRDEDKNGDKDGDHRHSHDANRSLHIDWQVGLGIATTARSMYPAKYTFDINAAPSCSADYIVYPVNATGVSSVFAAGDVTSTSTTINNVTGGTILSADIGRVITGTGIPANDTIANINASPATIITLAVAATATNTGETLALPGQPNIVGLNNLYSGTAGGTGICNRATPPAGDDGVSATTMWSYNITAAGGQVPTSPALSLDGTKVAFVESAPSTTAHFHVLAWKSGDGVDITNPNAQNVELPASITGFVTQSPIAGSGTATDLALASTSDTLSSPFVDYLNDVAYVGNDGGTLFRIKNVFCPALSACASGGTPAPSLDLTWPTSGPTAGTGTLTVCSGTLTGPIKGGAAGNIFVGCSDGKLYGFTSAGVALANPSITVGDGSATGGIVDPPLMDVVNGYVYAVSGTSGVVAVTGSILVQAPTDFSSQVNATLGAAGQFNLHAPAFNNAYFSAAFNGAVANVQGTTNSNTTTGSTSNWQIYEWADSGVAGNPTTLYGVGFDGSHVMTPGAASNSLGISGSTAAEFSPLTEILNGSTDQLFVSALANVRNVIEYNLTHFSPGLFPNVLFPTVGIPASGLAGASTFEGNGTSGIVVDNVSSSGQASSIYFAVPQLQGAVKLTQSGLN